MKPTWLRSHGGRCALSSGTTQPQARRIIKTSIASIILAAVAGLPLNAQAACNDGQAVTQTPSGLVVTNPDVASRFLQMASYGPKQNDVDYLSGMTIDAWLDQQIAYEPSCHYPLLMQTSNPESRDQRMEIFWKIALTGRDQLRQRLALALSEVLVVSEVGSDLPQVALAQYYDQLVVNGFTTYKQVLRYVAQSPAMGRYLSMLGNQKADESKGIRADENFARELMQLFTIGLVQLNQDGTPKLDASGNTIPSYTQADVEALARVMTGWNFAGTTEANFNTPTANWIDPMVPVEAFHDTGEKIFLGKVIPAGQTARDDFKVAGMMLYNHPNLPPFISKQLIQRLVTSNPSPEYVKRVAKVFINDGQGVRGNMVAVVRAILTDEEALGGISANASFGKQREPLLILSHLWRATNAYPPNGTWNYDWPDSWIGQAPLTAPSVFNWFRPSYTPPGALADADLVAPEFQTLNDASLTRNLNELFTRVYWNHNAKADGYDPNQIVLDTRSLLPLAQSDVAGLVAKLERLLVPGSLTSDQRQALIDYLASVPLESGSSAGAQRVTDALYLMISSPSYSIFR